MNPKNKVLILLLVIVTVFSLIFIKKNKLSRKRNMIFQVSNSQQLQQLFPNNVAEINQRTGEVIKILDTIVNEIIAQKGPTFENIVKKMDSIYYYYTPVHSSLHAIEMLSPDKNMRDAAHEQILKLTNYLVDNVSTNVALYKAFKNYVENYSSKEQLTDKQKYYVSETLKDFKRIGLDLPQDKLEQVRNLSKEIAQISLQFESNIAQHICRLPVSKEELAGLDEHFIQALPKEGDKIILGCDYPTYFAVMENCKVESTRKALYTAFKNRAYPKNMVLLDELIQKRAQLAKILGFESFAHLALDNQMAKNPDNVVNFLNKMIERGKKKAQKEIEEKKKDLPESVKLTIDGKLKPWDSAFLTNYYKKKYMNLDEQEVSKYFPMENTVEKLLHIYEEFFDIEFRHKKVDGLWTNDLQLIEAFDKRTNQFLGYIILDMYPRENKYGHAAHTTIVSAIKDGQHQIPYVGIVIANFPKSTTAKPSLLKFNDVVTFFHEFGHAIHAMLGATQMQGVSGTNVKTDFVELPSQMLEDWINDKQILKMISKHYQTNQCLPDDIIKTLSEIEKFDSGDHVLTQTYYALISLKYYLDKLVDTQAISKELYNKLMPHVQWQEDNHFQTSFGHLPGYGPSYYGYLWSKVYAKDLFNEIKKFGLLNPEIGRKYVNDVIGQGGSKDPNILLENFLGREPDESAFFKSLGL